VVAADEGDVPQRITVLASARWRGRLAELPIERLEAPK
jgi:hypothetical protein